MGVGFGGLVVVVYHRKIRPTQLWVELSWVVANINFSVKNLHQRLPHIYVLKS